MQIKDSKGQ